MTLLYFIGLDLNEQAECIWQGTCLAMRSEPGHKILLYRLHDFYAEVFYDEQQNEIVRIKGFRANSNLVPYMLL
jgi:hypothetical protein